MGEVFGYILASFIGVFTFYHGIQRLRIFYKLKKSGIKSEGVVINHLTENLTTLPVIEFSDETGNKIEGTPKNSVPMKPSSFHVPGDKVVVYFDKEYPTLFVIDAFSDKITVLVIFLSGCIFLSAVVYSLISHFLK